MNTAQKISRNTAVLFISENIAKTLGFFYMILMARHLGPGGYGTISFAIAFSGVFGVVADLGLQQLTIRDVSRDNLLASKFLGNLFILKSILAIITLIFTAIFINMFNYPPETINVVYIITISVVIVNFTGIFNSIFQAFERMEYMSIGIIINNIILFVGILCAIKLRLNVMGFAYIYIISNLMYFLYATIVSLRNFPKGKIELDQVFCKRIIIK